MQAIRKVVFLAQALLGLALSPATEIQAATLPEGFQESIVFSGLVNPTSVQFAPDGRVFVAEKRGIIKVFDSLNDATPDVFADLNANVYNFWDRGLLGLALDPDFATTHPYVYVLYTHDRKPDGSRWGTPGVYSDPCPTPPGPTADGCVVSGRLSRLQAAGNFMTGGEQVLFEEWCQQYPSHSVGDLAFGPDGALYVSGGDGASFNFVDYGQDGSPLNPCGDPPAGVGGVQTAPTAEGGSLRSQDLRTNSGGQNADPVTLDGAILRVDPDTGAGLPDNPLASSPDLNARRIIAYGLRNPFRMEFRPGTDELWVGDVGWVDWEEINLIADANDGVMENFGWPCYEGNGRQSGYDGANLSICENLYAAGPAAVTAPYHAYHHNDRVVAGETCPVGSSSIAGLEFEFYEGDVYPIAYDGALFFADYSRDCIWVIFEGPDGRPDRGQIRTFVAGAANPVYLETGPNGDLFYVDFDGGTVRRIHYFLANQPPDAVVTADRTSGAPPLTVNFDGTGSNDPEGGPLTYSWDLDGNGVFGDATVSWASYTYTQAGRYTVTLRVTDVGGASDTAAVVITVGNTPPTAVIDAPVAGTTWRVGTVVQFSGRGTDPEDGLLPASALSWLLILHHCPTNCHTHELQHFAGVYGGQFTAPDHEYPSHLELRLTATDSGGLTHTASLQLNPQTVGLTFQSKPGGLQLVVGGTAGTASFSRTVIIGSRNTISAPSPQTKGKKTYRFVSWSDGGAQTHDVIAPSAPTTYTATYR